MPQAFQCNRCNESFHTTPGRGLAATAGFRLAAHLMEQHGADEREAMQLAGEIMFGPEFPTASGDDVSDEWPPNAIVGLTKLAVELN